MRGPGPYTQKCRAVREPPQTHCKYPVSLNHANKRREVSRARTSSALPGSWASRLNPRGLSWVGSQSGHRDCRGPSWVHSSHDPTQPGPRCEQSRGVRQGAKPTTPQQMVPLAQEGKRQMAELLACPLPSGPVYFCTCECRA